MLPESVGDMPCMVTVIPSSFSTKLSSVKSTFMVPDVVPFGIVNVPNVVKSADSAGSVPEPETV